MKERIDGHKEKPQRHEVVKISQSSGMSGLLPSELATAANDMGLRGFKLRAVAGASLKVNASCSFSLLGDKVRMVVKGSTGLRPSMEAFATACERILRDKDPEEGDSWTQESLAELKWHLERQLADVTKATMNESPAELRKQLCDLANFAMMMWARAHEIAPPVEDE